MKIQHVFSGMGTFSDASGISVQRFQYPLSEAPLHLNWPNIASIESETEDCRVAASQESESGAEISAERDKAFDDGRREGIEEGRRIERVEWATRIEQCETWKIEQTASLSEQFALERDRFIHVIEPEIVKLALSIAERILRREVEYDPLMLTGAVRIALGQLADNTAARIHVPAKDAEIWNETLAHLPNLRVRPLVVADEELQAGECRIECNLGSLNLSVQNQLQETARMLLDQIVPGSRQEIATRE